MASWRKVSWRLGALWNSFWQNPVIARDFILNLRMGRYFMLMGLILLGGLGAIAATWGYEESNTPIGRYMFYVLLSSETVVILFLLPGLVANSLINERDRQILPMLLVTPLGPGKILIGKLFSTLGVIVLLIISTFPLISICLARGGVEPMELILGAAFVLYTSLLTASFALLYSLRASTAFQAIMLTLLSVLFCYFILTPGLSFLVVFASFMVQLVFQILQGLGLLVLNTPLPLSTYLVRASLISSSLLLLLLPVGVLLIARYRLGTLEPKAIAPDLVWETMQFQVRQERAPAAKRRIALWDLTAEINPFYLRENLGFRASQNPYTLPAWYILAVFTQGFFWLAFVEGGKWLAIFTLIIIAQMVPAFAGGLIAGEREAETWDLLRTSSASTQDLLHGKLYSALRHCYVRASVLYFLPLMLGTVLFGVVALLSQTQWSGVTGVSLLIHIPTLALHIMFLVLLCAYLSSRYRQLSSVYGWSYFLISMYLFAPLLARVAYNPRAMSSRLYSLAQIVSPVLILYDSYQFDGLSGYPLNWLMQIVLYTILSVGLYLQIDRRLQREE